MSSSRPLGIKKASSAYLKLISAALVTMSISVQSANAQKSSITLENALKRTLSNNPDLVVFEFKSSALDGESKMASLRPEMSVGVEVENVLGTGEVSGIKDAELTLTLSSVIELGDKVSGRMNVVSSKKHNCLHNGAFVRWTSWVKQLDDISMSLSNKRCTRLSNELKCWLAQCFRQSLHGLKRGFFTT